MRRVFDDDLFCDSFGILLHMRRDASSSNTHLGSICVTDQKSEVKTAMKSPDNSLVFPEKEIDFGHCTGANTVL